MSFGQLNRNKDPNVKREENREIRQTLTTTGFPVILELSSLNGSNGFAVSSVTRINSK